MNPNPGYGYVKAGEKDGVAHWCYACKCWVARDHSVGGIGLPMHYRKPVEVPDGWALIPWEEAKEFQGQWRDGIRFLNTSGMWETASTPNILTDPAAFIRRKLVKGPAMCMGCRITSDKESSVSKCLDGVYRCNDCALKAFKPAPPKSDAEIAWERFNEKPQAAPLGPKDYFIAGFNAEVAK